MSTILSLHGQGLKLNTRADIEPHLNGYDPTTISEIHLGGNTLGVEAAEALGEFLAKATALKVADFADIFTGRLISEIPLALTSIFNGLLAHPNPLLHTLNLSDNAFGGRSVDPFLPFLTTNTSLTTLKLNNNGLGPEGGRAIANAIRANAAHRKKSPGSAVLQTVICGRNRLEDGSADAWAEAFRAHGGLVEVRMPQNGIRPDGIKALADGLKECANLQMVDLQDNTFCASGEEAWSKALESWPDLTEFNLSDCVLREEEDEGVPKILKKLASGSNPKLATLRLQNNNLEGEALKVLAEAVDDLSALRRVEIQYNDFDEDEHEDLITAFRGALADRSGVLIINEEDEEADEANAAAAQAQAQAPTVVQPPASVTVPQQVVAKPGEPAPATAPGPVLVPAGASEPQPMQVETKTEEPAKEEKKEASVVDKATDALADLMSKVKIG